MGGTTEQCAVCEHHEDRDVEGTPVPRSSQMSRVVIEGRALLLCRAHTATVVAAMPETFEDLRALFVGAAHAGRAPGEIERRSPIGRREVEDRRTFPPRLEGRRMSSSGRRAADPRD